MRGLVRRPVLLAALLWAGGVAQASDTDVLLAALQQAQTLAARGTAEVSVFFPPRSVPTRQTNALPVVPFRPALIAAHFTVKRSEAPSLAGRDVTRFDLTPKVGQAARWTIWVDRTWNVPLAFEERMPDGTLARRAVFTSVRAQPARVQRPLLPVPAGLRAAVLTALPGVRFPPGFTPAAVKTRGNGLEITLSDGINVLALVIAPRGVRAAPGVASRRVGNRFVWLVGNLPDAPLRSALAGIQTVDEGELGTFLTTGDSNT